MLLSKLFATSALAWTALASPVHVPHVLHEKRDFLPPGWSVRGQPDRDSILPMRIALAQTNLDQGAKWLEEVSHPESEKYGKHWTAQEIAEAFAPRTETIDSVKAWLASAGIGHDRVEQSQSLGFLHFKATVGEAEDLLKTVYHVYEHEETGQGRVGCERYSIPSDLRGHVDFVYPTVHFDTKVIRDDASSRKRRSLEEKRTISPGVEKGLGEPGNPGLPKLGSYLSGKKQIIQELKDCDEQIIPNCLRALYEFPPNTHAEHGNSLGVVEYTPQAYVPGDLDMFFKNFSTRQVGNRPVTDLIDGAVVQQTEMSFGYNGESDLDLEYTMTLVYPQNVTLYQAGDTVEGASFNNFLDAIDASYCTYDGGDNNTYDAVYPDPYPGGYTGPLNCGGFAATKVITTSYAYNEHDLPPSYEERQCHEYMKLGMMGTSFFFSSGDYGVAGNGGECIDGAGPNAPYNNGSSGRFNPTFPATCPYVTAVGATQVKPGTNIIQALRTGMEPEEACETVIYSGGGFSNVFPIPKYQKQAVHSWFANYPPPYTVDQFNNTQNVRAYPDVAANGANYVIAVDGAFGLMYGTSASSPTFASVITLINQERLKAGKSSVGFINPVAYAHPEVFNDITEGGNQGCGTAGFSSAPGWDPVTGLGTPNFPKMLKLWLSLQ